MPSANASTEKGFTLIELIAVITILGVLAAVAMPRFVSLQTDARIAKLLAAQGAMQAAAAMVHGKAQLAAGRDPVTCPVSGGGTVSTSISQAGGGYVCAEGGRIEVLRYYPSPFMEGIIAVAGLDPNNFLPTEASLGKLGYGINKTTRSFIVLSVTGGGQHRERRQRQPGKPALFNYLQTASPRWCGAHF